MFDSMVDVVENILNVFDGLIEVLLFERVELFSTFSETVGMTDHFLLFFYFGLEGLIVSFDGLGLLFIGKYVLGIFIILERRVLSILINLSLPIYYGVVLFLLFLCQGSKVFISIGLYLRFLIGVVVVFYQFIQVFVYHIYQVLTVVKSESHKLDVVLLTEPFSRISDKIGVFL